ncbi:MAG: hypothetical protein A2V77_12755 [Anaeromyxobacter sp. RBG_16_69_14]|nr:MAG: hypothetical protein A2V77_12755 [Anaeromyxobacter sp. RBG_16_69_14]
MLLALAAPIASSGEGVTSPSGESLGDAVAQRPVVAAIVLQLPPGEDDTGLRDLVAVKVGEPLTRRAVRRTVQLLYGLGRFGNVVARTQQAAAAPGQVVLVLECLPRRTVASLRIQNRAAAPALDEERVRRAAGLAPGDELWTGRLEEAVARVRAAYARRGYPRAEVQALAEGEPRAKVTLTIEEGSPTRVAALVLTPAGAAPPGGLTQGLATRPGAPLDLDALDADVRALRARLRREGFLRSRVGAPVVTVEGTGARVEIPIDAGLRIDFRFAGAAAFSPAELRPQLGLQGEQSLDTPAVEAAAGRVRAFYLAHGYAAARVTTSEVRAAQAAAVVFHVDEGRRYRVRSVAFPGATQRSAPWLRGRLDEAIDSLAPRIDGGAAADAERLARATGSPATLRSHAPVDPREVWNPSVWDEAVLRVVELYRADGFLDAAHEGTRIALDARAGLVDVELRLREGVRTRVEAVAFEGNRAVSLPELVKEARISPGDPLAFGAVEATRAALLALYGRRGYLYARVADVEDLSPDHARATVRFRVEEGPQVRIGTVVVSGARRTRQDVVRETLDLHPGEVYDPDAAARSQTALLRLGVFRSVGLRLANADVPDATKDLNVELAERPWRTLAPGIGFSLANGPRAFVELVQPNLFGRALELASRVKVNYPIATLFGKEIRPDAKELDRKDGFDRVEGRAEVGLHYPRVRFLGLGLEARADAVAERLHRLAYDLSRGSVVFGIDFPWTNRVTLSLQWEPEVDHIVKTNTAQTLTLVDVERLRFGEGITTLQSVRPVLAIDYRDNSLHPRRGWLATGTADYVRSIGGKGERLLFGLVHGSDVFTHMLKLTGTVSGYLPVAPRSVLALSLRGGRVVPLDSASQTILPKRFYLGGATTMRGYSEEEMIPEDVRSVYLDQVRACSSSLSELGCSEVARQLAAGQTLVSQGGEAFLLAKAELRFSVWESVEMGVFVDAGNLWLDPGEASLADLRVNVGMGLRVLTPIGPAVLDLGVNTSPDGRLGERYLAPHFSIGLF